MSHCFGAVCQFGTEHTRDRCPEGCSEGHGFTVIDCPSPETCGLGVPTSFPELKIRRIQDRETSDD